MATATIQYRVNTGALHTDSIEVAGGDVISLTAASFAGWATPAARWEIVYSPPGWALPSGWTEDTSSGFYYYLAGSGGSGTVPPNITLPMEATTWGKWLFRLTVNGTIVSATIGVETLAPALGIHDLATGENSQFGDKRNWPGQQQDNLRIIDAAALASGGFVSSIAATTPLKVSAATGAVTATWFPTADVSMKPGATAYGFTNCTGLSGATVAISSTGGALTLDASTEVDIGATSATLVKIGRTGQTVRLPALAGSGAGYIAVDNSGNVAWGSGGSGAAAGAHYWEDAASTANMNSVATRDLAVSLNVAGQAGVVPIKFYTVGVAASEVEVVRWGRTVSDNSGHGTTGTITHASMTVPNAAGTETEIARFGWDMTTTIGPVSEWWVATMNSGSLARALTVGGNGNLTAVGSVTGTGFVGASLNTASAVALPIGGTNTAISFDSTTGAITYKKAGAAARVDTFDSAGANTSVIAAGATSWAESWTQAASGAGGQRSWSGQKGASGSIGGAIKFSTGAGGDAGAQKSGDFIIELGTLVSQASALFRLESISGGLIGSHGSLAGLTYNIKNGDVTTGGIYMQSTSAITIEATTTAVLQSTTGSVWLQPASGIVDLYAGSALGALLTFGPTGAQSLAMQARASTGANAGVTFTLSAQPGQAQSGGSANNNGGDLQLTAGAAGTGGGGAAGSRGNLLVTANNVNIQSDGAYRGPLCVPTSIQTANYSASFFELVRCSLPGGGFTVKLPDPVAADAGKMIWVKNEGSSTNTLTVTTTSGIVSIDDATSKNFTTAWGDVHFICTGANGYVMFPHS